MNKDFKEIEKIILKLKDEYIRMVSENTFNPNIPVTERDIVSELYWRLKNFSQGKDLYSHTEIKPAPNKFTERAKLKRLSRIDNVILMNLGEHHWIDDAIAIQNRYNKGAIEARFSSVPIEYFHTAIEVKIQSYFPDLKKDINKLRLINDNNPDCNCFLLLLNARGNKDDHYAVLEYAKSKEITVIEYTASKKNKYKQSNQRFSKKKNEDSINKLKLQRGININKPRRQRIVELLKQKYSDEQILNVLNKEYPVGTYKTNNKQAIYGTKRDTRLHL